MLHINDWIDILNKFLLSAFTCFYIWIAFLALPQSIDSTAIDAKKITAPTIMPTLGKPQLTHIPSPVPTPPISLQIKNASINSPVDTTGSTPDGSTMDVPLVFDRSFWYKNSAFPGTAGNVIIAGHLDGFKGVPAIFWNLNQAQIGEIIQLQTQRQSLSYKITQKEIVSLYDTNAWVTIMNPVSSIHKLTVITCKGQWIPTIRTRDERVVLIAEEL